MNYGKLQLTQPVQWNRPEPVREWLAWLVAATTSGMVPVLRD